MFNFEDGELETKNINGVEIFAVGTHNGKEFDESDLEQIVNSYRSVKNEIEAPIKAGHSNQLAINDGMPALGWVDKVYKEDMKVKADFKNVPEKVANLIKSRAFKKVSIELLPTFTDSEGNEHEKVLSGVALLGADTPAVKTLDDIPKLFDNTENEKVLTYSMEIEEYDENGNPISDDNPNEGDDGEEMSESDNQSIEISMDSFDAEDIDKEQVKEAISNFIEESTSEGGNSVDEEEVNELKQERDEFKEKAEELEEQNEELADKYSELQEKVLEYKLDSACQELGLAEDKEEKFCDFVTAQVQEFSDERAEEVIDDAKDLIGSVSEQPDTQEYTAQTGEPESGEKDVEQQVESILDS